MEEKKVKLISNKKLLFSSSILVCSIAIIGLSLTYAYFEATYTGSENVLGNKAATLNVTSNLGTVSAITGSELSLIESTEVNAKARKVEFTVSNTNSNIKAKYTIKLINYSLTKNLSSQYFKWKLDVKTNNGGNAQTFNGNFLDAGIATEGTKDTTVVSGQTKILVNDTNAIELDINETDTVDFYIWLENAANVNQLYLTNGSFSGKLSIEAFPVK